MNILHLTKDYTKTNGITTFIENLINNDDKNDHYVASNFISQIYVDQNNSRYITIVGGLTYLSFLKNLLFLISFSKRRKINIIHSHHRYYDLLGLFLKLVTGVKTVNTVNSKVAGKKFLSYKSDKIIVVGEAIKENLIMNFNISSKKITVINNFVDPSKLLLTRIEYEIREELGIDLNSYLVGFVGRFDINEKGIDILINSACIVIQQFPNVTFLCLGDGLDRDYLQIKTRLFNKNLIIIGPKTNIQNYMQIFNQLVLPSRVDPFPLVMLEAAYMKIPFIGSNVDGISEFIEDGVNGSLFESENHLQLAEKILFLKQNRDIAKRLADKNYKKVINSFLAEHKVPEYQREYLSLMKN